MHPSTRRAFETLERLADDERQGRGAFARSPPVDQWALPMAEPVPEYQPQQPRMKTNKPERARDETRETLPTRAYIERRLEQIVEMIGSESGANHRKLQEEIGQLRAEIAVLRTLLQASQEAARLRAEVAELKSAHRNLALDLPSLPLRPGH
jgi:hypothetical protein